MSIKLNPTSQIIARLNLEEYGKAHKFLADNAKRRMNEKFVPVKSGVLKDTSRVDYSDCSIVYNQVYAGYQYYGQRKDGTHVITHHTKAGTGPYWDKLMMSAEGKILERELNNAVRSGKFDL